MKVLAAMSGGVDSAVAAARAVDAGHDVVGVHLALARAGRTASTSSTGSTVSAVSTAPSSAARARPARGCCTIEDARDAARAADVLGIPFYVWDLAERFAEEVIDDFVSEYAAGRTPNPCVRCNEKIKFSALLDKALALGFDAVCTGHYARLTPAETGSASPPRLHRALDESKDQSYVLAAVAPERLAHALFPVADTSKADIRAEAARRGLLVADKPDSHDICFIPDGDTAGWLASHLGRRDGEIVDVDGRRVGRHDGAFAYTVGQRRGLRLGVPADDGRPRYVLSIEPVSNTVVVGSRDLLTVRSITGTRPVWWGPRPELGQAVSAQVRAHAVPAPAVVRRASQDEVEIEVPDGIQGVASGQTVVLYDGTRVVGAATICSTGGGG